ncbi:phosphohexomutase domain-containing protein [Tabrizicola fusiformis]|uniref:phosphomannomutase n=1 Tax=Tabrizicola sp. SY72 TaxID=2741673 RepID=UPI0015736FD2|nr:phosphomannomutase [Tabrizicola sp. SY72]NTT87287.1 phosphomannomutase [Tabrizicola sp. SY72]
MAPKFGTSGLRGLVVELTPDLVADHIRAFLAACPTGTGLWVGRDLRPSSPDLAAVVLQAARAAGLTTVDCGAVPTPALALAAMNAGAAAVMVTGSHIPADRNGLKFYLPGGEITKADEAAILAALGTPVAPAPPGPPTRLHSTAGSDWVARYVTAFGTNALAGLRLGIWSHSAVSRDLLVVAVTAMGAEAVELGRSDIFIPVDTEAVPAATRAQLAAWAAASGLDAVLSTDGDGDRPLLTDATGRVIPGDVLGQITAAVLGADTVVTPVSSNSGVEVSGRFARVIRTRIGSPFVIAAMEAAAPARVVGYEANGGFLLGFAAEGPAGPLPPLATRDSLLPLLAPLSRARAAGGLAALVAAEPPRFTASDRLEDIPVTRSQALIAGFEADGTRLDGFLAALGEGLATIDHTDGLRVTLRSGRVVHMRPSGNAPEFRLYAEAEAPELAAGLLAQGLTLLRSHLAA